MTETIDGCPNPACHERLKMEIAKNISQTEFEGLANCVRKKVDKSSVKWWVVLLLPLAFFATVTALIAVFNVKAQQSNFVTKETFSVVEKEHARTDERVKTIKEDIDELKEGQNTILRHLKSYHDTFEKKMNNFSMVD